MQEFENLAAEREVLSSIDHPFIVKMHSAFQTRETLCFVMDFLEGGELFFHLRENGKFTEEQTCFYAAQIVLAVEHLHSKNIMYRDLKPENILLDKEGNAVLTDFGLAKLGMSKNKKTKTM
jgi:serine/threonine protein kinase